MDEKTVNLVATRGMTHGDFDNWAIVVGEIKKAMESGENYKSMGFNKREALDMIAVKIGRIVCGDPKHSDHWDDIAGYALLGKGEINHEITKRDN